MDVKGSVRKSKCDSTPEHKKKKRRRYSSSDSIEESISSTASDSHSNTLDSVQKHKERELKRKKKEKKHRHKKEKLKKKKKKKSKKHKLARKEATEYDSAKTKESHAEPNFVTVEQPKAKRVMAPMTREEYEKQQSVMKHVLDPETGRYRLIKGDGEVMEEIVSRSRHKEINKQATKGDGATFQQMLGLG